MKMQTTVDDQSIRFIHEQAKLWPCLLFCKVVESKISLSSSVILLWFYLQAKRITLEKWTCCLHYWSCTWFQKSITFITKLSTKTIRLCVHITRALRNKFADYDGFADRFILSCYCCHSFSWHKEYSFDDVDLYRISLHLDVTAELYINKHQT